MRNKDKYMLMTIVARVNSVTINEKGMHVTTSEGTWSTRTYNYNVRENAIEAVGKTMTVYLSQNRQTGKIYYSSVHGA